MRDDYAHISLVVDRSGSMRAIRGAAEDGITRFVRGHQEAPGRATLLFTEFDEQHDTVYTGGIQGFEGYCLVPRGSTAMLDAIGRTIVQTGEMLSEMPEDQRPATVIFGIVTDGQENASREYTWEQVNAMITEQREKYQWDFVFLAANIDAAKVGSRINVANTTQYAGTNDSMSATYDAFTGTTVGHRAERAKGTRDAMADMPDVDEHGNVSPKNRASR